MESLLQDSQNRTGDPLKILQLTPHVTDRQHCIHLSHVSMLIVFVGRVQTIRHRVEEGVDGTVVHFIRCT